MTSVISKLLEVINITANCSLELPSLSHVAKTFMMQEFCVYFFRKFADIGNTVQLQYKQHLSSGWAELVTCHALPGPGVMSGLKSGCPDGCGCVIVAQMSSRGNLVTQEYTQGKWMRESRDV